MKKMDISKMSFVTKKKILMRARHFATDMNIYVITNQGNNKIDSTFKKMLVKFTPDCRFGIVDRGERYEFGFTTSSKPTYYLSILVLPPIGDWIVKSLS